jgi:uncharacterized ParB-like nuclease family protein
VPMSVINRPIPSQLDREKVEKMKVVLDTPGKEDELTPIVSISCGIRVQNDIHCFRL